MANLRLCPKNFYDVAVLAESPAMIATMPATYAQIPARDRFARSTSTADQVIQGHWNGNGRKIDSLFFFRHNGHGGRVRLQLYTYPNFSTQVYDSGTVDIYTLFPIESEWGIAPLGFATTDMLAAESPYSLFFTAVACSSFKITFSRCQGPYWELGRIFLGKYVEATYNPKYGMQFGPASNNEHQRTHGGSLRTLVGGRWNELTANMFFQTDAVRAQWRDLMAQITDADVAISIFPGFGGRQERDHVLNAVLDKPSPFAWANYAFNETVFKFLEV